MSDHRECLVRLERARLVCPYREYRSAPLMGLERAKKVEYFQGTGLLKQNTNLSVSVRQHVVHSIALTQTPLPR